MLIGLIFLVTFVVSLMISYLITRPIENLTSNIDKISKGQLDINLHPSEIYEINNLTDSLNRVMVSLKLAIHKVGVKKGEIFEDAVKAKEVAEKKQNDLLNSITGWAWETDEKGNYTYCTKNVTDLLGYTPGELIGKSVFDFIIPDDVKNVKQVFNEASKNKTPIKNLENWNLKKNGEKICVITNGIPFYDEENNLLGYRGVDTDITKEKKVEGKNIILKKELSDIKQGKTAPIKEKKIEEGIEKIETNKNKVIKEKLSEQEFDSVFIFDENANILDCNENMYKRLGYSKNELLSLNMADFDALESKNDLIEKINKLKKDGVYAFKTIHKRKDGSAILVKEILQYLKNENTFKGIVRIDNPAK